MGARQSKRSVDIAGATKKGELDNGTVEEGARLERLEEGDLVKTTQNGTAPHTATTPATEEAQPVANPDSAAATLTEETTPEKKEEVEEQKSEDKKDETTVSSTSESPEAADKEKAADDAASTPDKKKKEKTKMKWSFRSISFSRKDKSKPNVSKNEGKNGGVTKEPVIEVVEAEAVDIAEAIPVKDDEPKKDEPAERPEDEKKKEVSSTEVASPQTTPASPAETPVSPPAPIPVAADIAVPAEVPQTPATPQSVAAALEPVVEPVVEATPAPVVEAFQQAAVDKVQEVPVLKEEPVVEAKPEVKVEELPPPLPASPPPTEAPPPTPVATTPAPVSQIPDLADAHDNEVVGGGGESMADPEDVESLPEAEEKLDAAPLVNGISNHTDEKIVEDFVDKVDKISESFKTVSDSIISTQVVNENSEEKLEQTASAAE